jgi:hypothetical protein
MGPTEENGRETGAANPDGRGRSPGSRRTQFRPGASPNPGGRRRTDEPEVPETVGEVGDGAPAALKDLRSERCCG